MLLLIISYVEHFLKFVKYNVLILGSIFFYGKYHPLGAVK